jgi:hypothetical protein
MEAKGTLIFCPKLVLPHALGGAVSHKNGIFVKEVGTHSYREDFSTAMGIGVYGDIRLSARDMVSPTNNYF